MKIKKSQTADTRTCDISKVTKEQLLKSSKNHISDVRQGMQFLINEMKFASRNHDHTKIENIDEFYSDFKSDFKKQGWWKMHQKVERHHFNNPKYIQKDVNLIDVLEQIVDGCMAGMARSGEYRKEVPDMELLQKAYDNTAKMLLKNIKVIE